MEFLNWKYVGIPEDAEKPIDMRIKTEKNVNLNKENG